MTTPGIRILVDRRADIDVAGAVESIAAAIVRDRRSGEVGGVSWEMRETGGGVEIDRRQRLAAATLLMAFDLPQEMRAACQTMIEAADVCPGMTSESLVGSPDRRRRSLLEARALIDEMLAETDDASTT